MESIPVLRSHAIACDPMHGPCKKSHPMHGHAWTMHGHAWDYSWKLKNFKSRKKSFEIIFWKLEVASKKNFHLKKMSNFEKFEFDERGHFEFYHFWLSFLRHISNIVFELNIFADFFSSQKRP